MRVNATLQRSPTDPLPADDPDLMTADLRDLVRRWSATKDLAPIGAEAMIGADRRAQALGVPGGRLMEHAGAAVAAAVRAVAADQGRLGKGPILVLCGPGNNGGDGLVAARWLGRQGLAVVAVLVATEARPTTPDAARNWDRLAGERTVTRIHAGVPRDVTILGQGVEKASVVVDALLGSGVQGAIREPIRSAVELIGRAREAMVPVVAVDTPVGGRPHQWRAVGPGRPGRPDRHLPPPEDGPAHEARRGAGRSRPRRADRDPAGGGPWLTVCARSAGARRSWSGRSWPGSSSAWRSGRACCPADAQRLVFRTPLLIVILVAGTAIVLLRLVRRPPQP